MLLFSNQGNDAEVWSGQKHNCWKRSFPSSSRIPHMERISRISGTLVSLTISFASSTAAKTGRASFLFPEGSILPLREFAPSTKNFSIIIRNSKTDDQCVESIFFSRIFFSFGKSSDCPERSYKTITNAAFGIK